MAKALLNDEGDPIFYLVQVDLPETYPRHLEGSLRERYNYLLTQYYQLRHLWEIQLKHHRDHWNVRAAYDFWCKNGNKTVLGRQFGWNGNWLVGAIREVKAQVEDLEDARLRIKVIKAVNRMTVDLLPSAPTQIARARGGRSMQRPRSHNTYSSGTGTEWNSPAEKSKHHRQFSSPYGIGKTGASQMESVHRYNGLGSREQPITLSLESDDEDEGGPPHRGYPRMSWFSDPMGRTLRRRPAFASSSNMRLAEWQSNSPEPSPDNDYIHTPHTPIKQHPRGMEGTNDGSDSMSIASISASVSGSPCRKRERSRDVHHGTDRIRKSPKHESSDDTSGSNTPGTEHSGGHGGCVLPENEMDLQGQ